MSDDVLTRLENLWNFLDEEGYYVKANTVALAIDKIKLLSEPVAWRWKFTDQSDIKWNVQKHFPTKMNGWTDVEIQPLYVGDTK